MAIRPTHLRIALQAADAAADPVAGAIETALAAYCAGALSPDGHGNRAVPRAQTHFYEFRDPATWGLSTRRLFEAHPNWPCPVLRIPNRRPIWHIWRLTKYSQRHWDGT